MFEDYKTCPYAGLRPFTEEESIYFKGRDEHIDTATRQLEQNKFIMLTGASGDGKSSLVYAGIIPNAKAGFLKATFSNWSIVDFRPERSPLTNLSNALAKQLGVNPDTVRTELGYGFSALVDIYKSSALYYDMQSAEWAEESEQSKKEKKRGASNLIILADQFEEFFTNPENFEKGVPSREASSVTNLLLETARIALEENLPIYVVITMRSDFIGQCAAFRGLPEYIGFSQFFVPRLNRQELREVIEEPAVLSGNTISRRLTERLIHDIVEGTDQLPILQHALNQVWKAADDGEVTMDLIHYAMVGGMKGSELPEEDHSKFNTWFASLPENVQQCYDQPDLQNVLNTHADKLYIQDGGYVRDKHKEDISDDDVKLVIKAAFKCLTKINNGRAVRNRMTLGEITAIINVPHLNSKVVGRILDVFREPGNTLLRPFSEETPELNEGDVLDITHESLIRNWENLDQWAKEEYNSYMISRDFGHQLNRWLSNHKSDDFLLYMGPLTYFEKWISDEKPNAAWIARYLEGEGDKATKLARSNAIDNDSREFLKRSARKHIITRTIVRYGAGKIAAVLAIVALLTLTSFLVSDYWRRQDAYVLNDLKQKSLAFAGNKTILMTYRAVAFCEEIMHGDVTIPEIAAAVDDPIERINIITGVASQLVYQGTNEPRFEIKQGLTLSDSLLASFPVSFTNGKELGNFAKELVDLSDVLELAYFYNPEGYVDALRMRNGRRCAQLVMDILHKEPATFLAIDQFDRALEHAINRHAFTADELHEITGIMSPFGEKSQRSAWIESKFARDRIVEKGFFQSGFNFNGFYQELGYMFAAQGNAKLALAAIDTLLTYNASYFQRDYSTMPDNAYHIAGTFYDYGHLAELDQFVSGYCARVRIKESDFYDRLLARCKAYEFTTAAIENDQQIDESFNLNLEYSSFKQIDFFFTKYRDVLNATEKNADERNFRTALSYKDQGIIQMRKLQASGADSLWVNYMPLFDKAVATYMNVTPAYLEGSIPTIEISSNDEIMMARKFLFIYPDVRTSFHPNEPQLFHFFYTTEAFLEYMLDHDLFNKFYPTEAELKFFQFYLRDYHFVENDAIYTASRRMPYTTMVKLEKALAENPASRRVNLAFLYLLAAREAADHNEPERLKYYTSQITGDNLRALFFNSFNQGYTSTLTAVVVGKLVLFDLFDDADRIVRMFKSQENRGAYYAFGAESALLAKIRNATVDRMIDSSAACTARVETLGVIQSNRIALASALALRGRPGDLDSATSTLKNIPVKYFAVGLIVRGLARNDNTYDAANYVARNISKVGFATAAGNIFYGCNMRDRTTESKPAWSLFVANRPWFLDRPTAYVDEGN